MRLLVEIFEVFTKFKDFQIVSNEHCAPWTVLSKVPCRLKPGHNLVIEILPPADFPDQPSLLVVKLEPNHPAHPGHHLGEGLALLKLLNLSFVTLPHLQEDIYS